MKKVLTVTLLLALALGTTALAGKRSQRSGGFGGFGPTVAFADFNDLNSELAKKDVEELSSLHWMMGGSGYAHIGRIVIGGSGWGGTQTVSSESLRIRVDLGGGHFEAGYCLLNMRHLIVTPMLGIGAQGYTITLEGLLGSVPGFGALLENPGRTSQIAFTEFTITPELAITIPVTFIGLQLKAGYAYTPTTPEWKLSDGASLNRGPKVAKGYPFVNLNIIFGGFGPTKRRG